ncbi:MAG: hypothetical protein ABI577_10560 [bacterium]
MPDLRQKRKAKPHRDRHGHHGVESQLPNTAPTDSESLPGDVARDISQDGVAYDPGHGRHS